MTMMRVLTVVLVAVMAVAVSPSAAVARCIGPQVRHDRATVDRDGIVHVVGTYWGDNCYDTGEPPAGEGRLGRPVAGIEIYLVQDGIEHLVATGDADENYTFEVDVPVPDELMPGPAEVIARMPAGLNSYDVAAGSLTITNTPLIGSSEDAPVRFDGAGQGPVTTTTTATSPPGSEPRPSPDTSSSEADDDGGVHPAVVAGAVLLVVGLVAAGVYLVRRRRA